MYVYSMRIVAYGIITWHLHQGLICCQLLSMGRLYSMCLQRLSYPIFASELYLFLSHSQLLIRPGGFAEPRICVKNHESIVCWLLLRRRYAGYFLSERCYVAEILGNKATTPWERPVAH